MYRHCIILTIATIYILTYSSLLYAFDKGDMLLRGRVVAVMPDESAIVSPIGGDLYVNNVVLPEVDISYFLTTNFAVEGLLGIIPHKAKTKNTAIGDQDAGRIWAVAPTILLQYHYKIAETIKPYLGMGMAYIRYIEDNADQDIKYKSDIAAVAQLGVDISINDYWSANLDIKKIWADTQAKVDGGVVNADIRLDPWVIGVGLGYKF